MFQYDCARCGILVVNMNQDPHPEIYYCAKCRFIESLDSEDDKRAVEAFLDRQEFDVGGES